MHIALFDDDLDQAELILQALARAGHSCRHYTDGAHLTDHLRRETVDMLVMNLQASGQTGMEIIHWARACLPATLPVLFITDPGTEDDIVAALAAGASEYIVKPVRRRELATRAAALMQRAYPERHAGEQLRFGRYSFEPRSGRLEIGERQVALTRKEFTLALLFFKNLGKPLSRVYIQESVWPQDDEMPSRTLDTHVSRVRSKLQLQPENGFRLTPVYSYGYRLEQLDR